MSAVLSIEPKLNAERQLTYASHHFDRKRIGLDFLFPLCSQILQIGSMFLQRMAEFVREKKYDSVCKISICAI